MGDEQRNLRAVERWAELYNTEGAAFVEACYAPDVVVECPGALALHGRESFTAIEEAVCAAAPRRWFRIDRQAAHGDVVFVEATLFDPDQGADFETRFVAVLTFDDDGLVVNDTTYLDPYRWPMPEDVATRMEGTTVRWLTVEAAAT